VADSPAAKPETEAEYLREAGEDLRGRARWNVPESDLFDAVADWLDHEAAGLIFCRDRGIDAGNPGPCLAVAAVVLGRSRTPVLKHPPAEPEEVGRG